MTPRYVEGLGVRLGKVEVEPDVFKPRWYVCDRYGAQVGDLAWPDYREALSAWAGIVLYIYSRCVDPAERKKRTLEFARLHKEISTSIEDYLKERGKHIRI